MSPCWSQTAVHAAPKVQAIDSMPAIGNNNAHSEASELDSLERLASQLRAEAAASDTKANKKDNKKADKKAAEKIAEKNEKAEKADKKQKRRASKSLVMPVEKATAELSESSNEFIPSTPVADAPKGKKKDKISKKGETTAPTTPLVIVSARATVKSATMLNGDKDDFSPIFYQKGILFCSNSRKANKDAILPEDLNLKYAAFDSVGNLERPMPFNRKLNSKTNEGPSCFSKDGKTMFLTRNASKNGKETLNKQGNSTLKIYIKQRLNDSADWSGEEILPFETENYSYCHPTLSADGKKLYFSSNIPGGFGGMDLFYCRRLDDGTWSQPINLGPRVNTPKNEIFPWINEKGLLFFASNGIFGAQGLDLFKIDIENRLARTTPMGEPFNTEGDDFGIMFLPNSVTKGYFSSNRKGGNGGDDIYEFELKAAPANPNDASKKMTDTNSKK